MRMSKQLLFDRSIAFAAYLADPMSRLMQSPAMMSLAMAMLAVLCQAGIAMAQSGGGSVAGVGGGVDIETLLKNIFNTFYLNFRIPVVATVFIIGGILIMTDDQNGIRRAIKVVGGGIIVAMVPSIIRYIADITGTSF